MPTLQNPTSRSMSLVRRKDLIRVARHLKLTIVEDDNYAVYAEKRAALPPLVSLAPDICYYVGGLSKSIAPGLRTGYVLAPDSASTSAIAWGVRASCFASQSMGFLITQQALEDGAAEQIIKENRKILRGRGQLLRGVLGLALQPGAQYSPHVWMPLSAPEAARIENRLMSENIRVTGALVPALEGAKTTGLRFCIGATRRDADFERALTAIKRTLEKADNLEQRAIV
jgi:DNA-binding transcriptional MocR family regulator